MPLKFPGAWRIAPPSDSEPIPYSVISDCYDLITRIATQGNRRELLEHFKEYFAKAVGSTSVCSSSESWAETDLRSYMDDAASNPPLFLEALYDSFEVLRKDDDITVPDLKFLNKICRENGIDFEIRPPNLVKVGLTDTPVSVPEPPATLAEQAMELLHDSMNRSEELLIENRPEEAVQKMWWILESVATAFRGSSLSSGVVQGTYFNQIAKDLQKANPGTTLYQVLKWCLQLHSYHSSTTDGGVRHGRDLQNGTPMTLQEGRLYCNLIRSYISFLLLEHERLTKP